MYNKKLKAESDKIQQRTRELVVKFGFNPTVSRRTGRYSQEASAALDRIMAEVSAEFPDIPKDRRRRNVTKVTRSIKPTLEN